jgi:hypothetical protein
VDQVELDAARGEDGVVEFYGETQKSNVTKHVQRINTQANAKRPYGHVPTRLSTSVLETVHVDNMPTDMSVQQLMDAVSKSNELANVVSIDRAAILKFRRSLHCQFAIPVLKKLEVDGEKLNASRFVD